MKKILVSIIIFFCALYLSCEGNDKWFQDLFEHEDLYIFGVVKISEVEIVIVKQGDDFYGNFFLLVFSEKGKILHIDEGYFTAGSYPFFFDDDYFVIFGVNRFHIYSVRENKFYLFDLEYYFIAYLVIFNDNLYYSTDKTNTTITRIDLKTGEIKEYIIYTPNAPFYVVEGAVYIKAHLTGKVYLVEKDKIVPQDVSILEGAEPVKYDMSDLKIEEIKKYEDMLGLKYRVFPFPLKKSR